MKRVKKAKIDYNGLPGKNKTEKKREFDLFVASVMQRCNAENKYASLKSKGSGIGKLNSVKAKLKGVKEAVLACHTGNCGTPCNFLPMFAMVMNIQTDRKESMLSMAQ